VFWDCQDLLLVRFMPYKPMITGEIYVITINALSEPIKTTREFGLRNFSL
jgi:hypothetical protein